MSKASWGLLMFLVFCALTTAITLAQWSCR